MTAWKVGREGAFRAALGYLQPGHLEELWPEAQDLLKRVDLILHAGDVLGIQVVGAMSELAPVLVVLGNNDSPLVGEDPRTKPSISLTSRDGEWASFMIASRKTGP